MTSADRGTDVTARDGDAHTPRGDDAHEPRARVASESRGPGGFVPLALQAPLEPRAGGRYSVDELLAFHDRAFVESAYAAALGREATAGELSSTLADLRLLRREKIEIIEDLIGSEEGRRAGARERIAGVGSPNWKRRVRRLPVVGYVWQLTLSVLRLPVSLRHARESETYALAQQQLIADHVNTQLRALLVAQDELRRHLEAVTRGVEEEMRARADEAHRFTSETRRVADEARGLVGDAIAAVSVLSDALAALAGRQSGFERRLDSQHEYVAQEQQAIVEAQKAALAEIEARLADLLAPRDDATAKLPAREDDSPRVADPSRRDDPRAIVEEARSREGERGEVA